MADFERDPFHPLFYVGAKPIISEKPIPPVIPPPYSFMFYAEDDDDEDIELGPFAEDGPSGLPDEHSVFPPIQNLALQNSEEHETNQTPIE